MTCVRIDRLDLRIWIGGAAVALALHASFALRLIEWHDPIPGDEGAEPVLLELAPSSEQPQTPVSEDLAPGPLQEEAPPAAEPPKEEPQQQMEKVEPLPTIPHTEAALPKAAERPIEEPKIRHVKPPARTTSAPPRPRPSAAQISNWHRKIAIQLERHKGYPAQSQARHETGTATVAFTIDRNGRLLSSRLVHSSSFASLDAETLATVRRAAPFPPPPADMPGSHFDFRVPIRFNIR